MPLLATLAAIKTALTDIPPLVIAVKTALADLNTFLAANI